MELPRELWEYTFGFCSLSTLCKGPGLVCKEWHRLATKLRTQALLSDWNSTAPPSIESVSKGQQMLPSSPSPPSSSSSFACPYYSVIENVDTLYQWEVSFKPPIPDEEGEADDYYEHSMGIGVYRLDSIPQLLLVNGPPNHPGYFMRYVDKKEDSISPSLFWKNKPWQRVSDDCISNKAPRKVRTSIVDALLCVVLLRCVELYCVVLRCCVVVLCCIVLLYCVVALCCVVLCCVVLCCVVLCCVVLCCVVLLRSVVLCVLCCVVLCCAVWCCVVGLPVLRIVILKIIL